MGPKIKICVIHPLDPLGSKIGGTGTFLRGFVKYAPEDFEFQWVGVTSNSRLRPVRSWQEITLGRKRVRFYPLLHVEDENRRLKIPLTLRFTMLLSLYRNRLAINDRILMFDRIEPVLPFRASANRKVLFIHSNKQHLYSLHSEVKWKYFPLFYFVVEKRIIAFLDKIFLVREDEVGHYRKAYPDQADRFSFVPTWVDEETFYPMIDETKQLAIKQGQGFNPDDRLIVFVGRLEGAKDPFLLLDTFLFMRRKVPSSKLLIIGTGSLERQLVSKTMEYGLQNDVRFYGALPQPEVAELLRISDVFLLASAFEGMPRSVLEALACGLPVVTTNVGEVKRVVIPGMSGKIVDERTPEALGAAAVEILNEKGVSVHGCISSVSDYQARKVLGRIYETYYAFHRPSPSSVAVVLP